MATIAIPSGSAKSRVSPFPVQDAIARRAPSLSGESIYLEPDGELGNEFFRFPSEAKFFP